MIWMDNYRHFRETARAEGLQWTVFALKEKQIKQIFWWEFTIDQPARMMPSMSNSKWN